MHRNTGLKAPTHASVCSSAPAAVAWAPGLTTGPVLETVKGMNQHAWPRRRGWPNLLRPKQHCSSEATPRIRAIDRRPTPHGHHPHAACCLQPCCRSSLQPAYRQCNRRRRRIPMPLSIPLLRGPIPPNGLSICAHRFRLALTQALSPSLPSNNAIRFATGFSMKSQRTSPTALAHTRKQVNVWAYQASV